MSFAGGGGDSVTVSINGSSVGLVDALRVANEQLQQTARIFDTTAQASASGAARMSDANKLWIDSLNQATEMMSLTSDRMKVLTDMAGLMGAATAESADAWLAASSSAADYGARLEYLAAQTKMVADSQDMLSASMSGSGAAGGGGFLGGLGGMLGGGGGGLLGEFGMLGDVIEGTIGKMADWVTQAASMVAGLISFTVLNDVIQEVENFTDALVQLNEQTEKNQFAWQYLYGGGNNPKGQAIAQGMADWTKSFSMQIPYTRQDLLNAITNLAPMGLSAQGLEHFMPTIADLAATRDPNANLAQVAQVIMSASMGYTRMLKYDLKINPEDLIQYGLKATSSGAGIHIEDPNTLLPALQAYAQANHLAGAAQDVAHSTFWGQWSSFIDRIQNFELNTGDKLFGNLKQTLNDLSSWIDTHQDQITRFSDLIGNGIGGAFKTAADWVGQFAQGLGASGIFDIFNVAPKPAPYNAAKHHAGAPAPTPKVGSHVIAGDARGRNLAQLKQGAPAKDEQQPTWLQSLGQGAGVWLKYLGDIWSDVSKQMTPQLVDSLTKLGKTIGDYFTHMPPDTLNFFKQLSAFLLKIPFAVVIELVKGLTQAIQVLGVVLPPVVRAIEDGWHRTQDFLDAVGNLKDKLGQFKDSLGQLKDNLTSWASDIRDKALNWGQDMITAFAQGMKNAIPNIGDAAGSVASTIGHILHHSTPDMGPLAGDDQWMPDMMRGFAAQIRAGTGDVAAAMTGVAAAMVAAMRPSGGYAPAGGYGNGNAGGTVIVINGSSTMDVLKIIDAALAHRDAHTNTITRAPGGFGLYTFGTPGGVR